MKKIITIVALLICTISLGQELNSNSKSLKLNNLKEFNKVELLVQKSYNRSEPIYNIMINAQVDARAEVVEFMRGATTDSKLKKVRFCMGLSSEVVNGVKVFNWVLLNAFLNRN